MKNTIVSIFFSNGDLLKIDLAEKVRKNKSNIGIPGTETLQKTGEVILYSIKQKKKTKL